MSDMSTASKAALVAVLKVAGAKEINDIKSGVASTFTRLSIGPENVEKADVASIDRNYNILFGLMDMLRCEVPTSATLRKAIKTVDQDHECALTSKFKSASGKRAWYHYEGEQMHKLASNTHRHFTCKKLRDSIPRTMKTILLKDLWKKHRPDVFQSSREKLPLSTSLLTEKPETVSTLVALEPAASSSVPKVGDSDGLLDDYPLTPDDENDLQEMQVTEVASDSETEDQGEEEGDNVSGDKEFEEHTAEPTVEEIDVVSSSDDEDEVVPETVAVWKPPEVQATKMVPRPEGIEEILKIGASLRPVDPASDQIKVGVNRRCRGKAPHKTTVVATSVVQSPLAAAHPVAAPVTTPVCAAPAPAPLKKPRIATAVDDSFKVVTLQIVRKVERKRAMFQLRGKNAEGVHRAVMTASCAKFGGDKRANAACSLIAKLLTDNTIGCGMIEGVKHQLLAADSVSIDDKSYALAL